MNRDPQQQLFVIRKSFKQPNGIMTLSLSLRALRAPEMKLRGKRMSYEVSLGDAAEGGSTATTLVCDDTQTKNSKMRARALTSCETDVQMWLELAQARNFPFRTDLQPLKRQSSSLSATCGTHTQQQQP